MRKVAVIVWVCTVGFLACRREKPLPKEISELPEEFRVAVQKAVEIGQIEIPGDLAGLVSRSGTDEEDSIVLEMPVATYVSSTTPLLRWQRQPRLQQYQAHVLDSAGKVVAESPITEAGEWKCEPALKPGQTYRWSVTAKGKRAQVGSPEACFAVPAQPVLEQLAGAKQRLGDNGLALAVIYARAGVVDEAERLLAGAIVRNPTSEEAKRLYRSLKAQRLQLKRK
jgi:hypothetical protein